MSTVTKVELELAPGELVATDGRKREVSVVAISGTFYRGKRESFPSLRSVLRNKDGEWGKRAGGYVSMRWSDVPAPIYDRLINLYRAEVAELSKALKDL